MGSDPASPRPRIGSSELGGVGLLVLTVTSLASVVLFASAHTAWQHISARPGEFAIFLLLTVVLQVLAVDVYGRGSIAVSGIGFLAVGFAFGPGAGMIPAIAAGAVHGIKKRSQPHKAAFNAAVFSLATFVAALVFAGMGGRDVSALRQLGAACLAGAIFTVVNLGLLSSVMSIAEGLPIRDVWRERFRWLTPHYLAFGPLALAAVIGYESAGPAGFVAFALPPALMIISVRQYLDRTRTSVEEVRAANAALEERNEDLQRLLDLSTGLAARAHDRDELVRHVERALAELCGGRYTIQIGADAEGVPLVAGGNPVGALSVDADAGEAFDEARWSRLQETFLSHLSTALESAELVREVRERHKATIAALSRSMEVKDGYTGGHTERVSDVAAAVGRRLGFKGEELDAIEIGALLHDIGKIGIPERILHKPGPLDEEEWEVMKTHPVLSEHILAGVGLSPVVLQVARSSHERIDGQGYPDGLIGEEIPLPARIVLVADAFDALTSDRPYRKGTTAERAIEEIRAHTGTQFCPRVLAALERVYREEPELLGATRLRVVAG